MPSHLFRYLPDLLAYVSNDVSRRGASIPVQCPLDRDTGPQQPLEGRRQPSSFQISSLKAKQAVSPNMTELQASYFLQSLSENACRRQKMDTKSRQAKR